MTGTPVARGTGRDAPHGPAGSADPSVVCPPFCSREYREGASFERLGDRIRRQTTARERDEAATDRDRMAEIRDEGGRGRDAHATDLELPSSEREAQLHRELEELRALIGVAIEADAGVGISVGFAELESGDTADGLTERADAAMLGVKAVHRARS